MRQRLVILLILFLPMVLTGKIPVAQAELTDGLMAYYPFDGTAEDMSGNGNNGSEQGEIEYKMGFQGDSASFDGEDDYIRVPNDPTLNPVDQLSISFWIKVEEYTNTWSPLVHKGGPKLFNNNNREYSIWLNKTSSFLLSSAGDNSESHQQSACCAKSDWTHYVGIVDRRNHRVRTYIDGILVTDDQDDYSTFNTNEQDILIGWSQETHTVYSPFKGRIDELRIYNRVLSETEIQELSSGATPFLVGCHKTQNCSLEELFNGSSYQVDDLLLTNWQLVDASNNVNITNIEIGPGYNTINEFAVWAKDHELFVGRDDWLPTKTLSLSFDFLITATKGDLTQLTGSLAYRRVSGRSWPPWVKGTISFGTSKGNNDLGSTTHLWNTNGNQNSPSWITMPSGLNKVWVRNTISLSSSPYGYAEAGYNSARGPAFRISYKENRISAEWLGEILTVCPSSHFTIAQQTQENFTLQISNSGDTVQYVMLEILNINFPLKVEIPELNPIELAVNKTLPISIAVDTGATPVGVYDDLLLKFTTSDGELLYSNITITVTKPEETMLPDLDLVNGDIRLVDYTLGKSAILEALIHNKGSSPATDVHVQFYEFDTLLGEITLDEIGANSEMLASVSTPLTVLGEHLIRVVVDPNDEIIELTDRNNEANHLVTLRTPPVAPGSLTVTGNLPSHIRADELFTIEGLAIYDVLTGGNSHHAVKRGTVQVTIADEQGNIWQYGRIFTDVNGNFKKLIQAPGTPGIYHIALTISDDHLSASNTITFSNLAPSSSPDMPLPPEKDALGSWQYEPSSGIWTWICHTSVENSPCPGTDLQLHAKKLLFSNNHPATGDEVTISTEIDYWAASSQYLAQNIPVTFYSTSPDKERVKIGTTILDRISVGFPDFGSRSIYTSWQGNDEGVHIIEVEIDPSFMENNRRNNVIKKAIVVGNLSSSQGIISGQVTDFQGGITNAMIELQDVTGGIVIASSMSDDTGFYLFKNVPAGNYQMRISPPARYRVGIDTSLVQVTAQEGTVVGFMLTGMKYPVADAGSAYTETVGITVTLDASGSRDPDGNIVLYEWDCNNDGVYDLSSATPIVEHVWEKPYNGTIHLRVTDNEDMKATTTAKVTILKLPNNFPWILFHSLFTRKHL